MTGELVPTYNQQVLDSEVGKPGSGLNRQIWQRIAVLAVLTTVAYAALVLDAVRGAFAGSYTGFILVMPVLAILIASALRPAPGVGDTEFDWIVAVIVAAAGFLAIALLSRRLPSLAGLWHWAHFQPTVWAIAAATVLFSVRHVLRLWRVWFFVLCCAPAMPYLLVTAQLGGTEDNAVVAGAALGTLAVYLATSPVRLPWRLLAATVNLGMAAGLGHLLGGYGLLPRTLLIAGVVPVLTVTVVRRWGHVRLAPSLAAHPARGVGRLPAVGVRSYAVLALLAGALLASSPPVSAGRQPALADRDWVASLGLQRTAGFDFIQRFAGPGATLTRYTLPPPGADPAVAIDVIAAPNLARLADYADAVWYPSPVPVNYRPVDIAPGIGVRSASSDPDSAGADTARQWYALSWVWRATTGYQQVTVVVNQDLGSAGPPPPQPLTWTNSLLEPMMWLTRQQPAPSADVPKKVSRTAEAVARRIVSAGTG